MTSSIYDLHDKAFNRVSAYVVMDGAERLATIAFKFPADGAGRLYCYVHWVGLEMVRGFAGGYGYDKKSAAVADAMKRARDPVDIAKRIPNMERMADYDKFRAALSEDGGQHWDRRLEDAGFKVWQAV